MGSFLIQAVQKWNVMFLLALSAGLSLFVATGWLLAPRRVEFRTLPQFIRFVRAGGFAVHSGSGNPELIGMVCYVSDHPLGVEQISRLSLDKCGLTPEWKGIVWVGIIDNNFARLAPETLGGHRRIWGNVAAGGDPELLDRLQDFYDRHGDNR